MSKAWRLFDALSVGFLLALSLNLLIIFFISYISGQPAVVSVNTFTEGYIEAVLFPIWFLMGTVTLVRLARRR